MRSFLPSSDRSLISRVHIDVDVDGAGVVGGVFVARQMKKSEPFEFI